MVSMFGMTAFAEDGGYWKNENNIVTIQKSLKVGSYLYTPDVTFTFLVSAADAVSGENFKAEAGIPGAIIDKEVSIAFSKDDGTVDEDADWTIVKNSADNEVVKGFKFDATKFPKVGIYHYQVEEINQTYEGMKYAEPKDLYVYVTNKMDDNDQPTDTKELTFIMEDASGVKSEVFANEYGTDSATVGTLTIEKQVKGLLGNLDTPFEFHITVTSDPITTEQYYMIIRDDSEAKNIVERKTIAQNTDVKFELQDGYTATIYGLSKSDGYEVWEVGTEGYGTEVNDTPIEEISEDGKITGNAIEMPSLVFTNTNKGEVPTTGLILNIAPYVLMVVLAGGLAFLFLRRRKNNF